MNAEGLIPLAEAGLPVLAGRGLPVPAYDRSRLRPRIAHIGVGGFHRSHLAVYCDELAGAGSDWGIRGIGLLPHDRGMAETLTAQDHLYIVTEKDNDERRSRVIGSLIDYVLADGDPAPAVAAIADAETAIVSMTITEAGYGPGPANERTFDVIAAGLAARRDAGHRPVTVMSCDNLRDNGDAARSAIVAAARRHSHDLATWIASECSFPTSMVDRITPAATDHDRVHLRERFGVSDGRPVVCEPFRQWVLEDHFVAGRPRWEDCGVIVGGDVAAWERYKLHMLNAGHSVIAYLAALAGRSLVHEALAEPALLDFLSAFLEREAPAALRAIPGHPPADYAAAVLRRFTNTGVEDQIGRLCIDGSAKFPTFLSPTIEALIARGEPARLAALALAGWAHYLARVPLDAQAADAGAAPIREQALRALGEPALFLVGNPAIPAVAAAHPGFTAAFVAAHRAITERGALAACRGSVTAARGL